ncbi:MAG TPA: hypothetical protein VMA34_02250 [Terracidiphilus sp.]|nr:hypothetical protein [Terracidiphilus sp.]
METTLEKAEVLSIKDDPRWDEALIQQMIAENPSILGLGPLLLRDKERTQPHKGRLDLLLQSEDATAWYEVEVQLGATDESHIIRTIEYWDIERKRYPDLQHTAVIVAEEITSRFFNVINLFNQAIPIITLKLSAVKIGDKIGLLFTKVLDYERKGLEAAGEITQQVTRADWEKYASTETMRLVDKIYEIAKEFDSRIRLTFNKSYITANLGDPHSIGLFMNPQKSQLRLTIRIPESKEIDELCESQGFDPDFSTYWGGYKFAIKPGEFERHSGFFRNLIERVYRTGQTNA